MRPWNAAEKAQAWRLYRSHASRAIAEIMGRDRADVSEMMRRINTGQEPRPAIDIDMLTEAETADYRVFRDHKFSPEVSLAKARWRK